MLTAPTAPASVGIRISHSHMVANFRYETLVACAVWRTHSQAATCQSTQGQDSVLHKPGRVPGFTLEKFVYLASMTLTQVPSQAELQLCLQEETCMHFSNLISASLEPSLPTSRHTNLIQGGLLPRCWSLGHAYPGGNGCWQDTAHLVLR